MWSVYNDEAASGDSGARDGDAMVMPVVMAVVVVVVVVVMLAMTPVFGITFVGCRCFVAIQCSGVDMLAVMSIKIEVAIKINTLFADCSPYWNTRALAYVLQPQH